MGDYRRRLLMQAEPTTGYKRIKYIETDATAFILLRNCYINTDFYAVISFYIPSFPSLPSASYSTTYRYYKIFSTGGRFIAIASTNGYSAGSGQCICVNATNSFNYTSAKYGDMNEFKYFRARVNFAYTKSIDISGVDYNNDTVYEVPTYETVISNLTTNAGRKGTWANRQVTLFTGITYTAAIETDTRCPAGSRIYGLRVYNGSRDSLLHEYLPVYNYETKAYGLLDTVTDEFYGNTESTGTITGA